MKYGIMAPFDPMTQYELDQAKLIAKTHGECYLYVEKDGIVSYQERVKMVKKAIAPFRHLHLLEHFEDHIKMETNQKMLESEHQVRCGKFYLVAQGLQAYLLDHAYYLDQLLQANLSEHRYLHSCSVASLAKELALVHGVDVEKAYLAGMLHDVTKHQSDAYHENILRIYDPDKLDTPRPIMHSFTAVVFLKQNLGLHDQSILNAIYHHATGTGNSKLAKILYIADKCERTRGYDSSSEISLSKRDLNAGFELVQKEARAYIEQQNKRKNA